MPHATHWNVPLRPGSCENGLPELEAPKAPMATNRKLPLSTNVLTFDKFWKWLQVHPNCILSAGTPEAELYDDEDFHWHFGTEDEGALLVQVLRGKQFVGEVVIAPRRVTYVQSEAKGDEEFLFECVAESESEPVAAYHFVLSHDYSPEEPVQHGRWVH